MYSILKSNNISSSNIINLKKKMNGEYLLHSFTFTNDVYNITSNNNILPYQDFGGSLTEITLTQQYINASDLASHLQTKINAVTSGMASVSYDSNTGKFTITNTVSFRITFGDYTSSNGCHNLLGFSGTNLTYATTQTSDNTANLVPFQCIYVKIKQNRLNSIYDENYGDYSLVVTVDGDFGARCSYISPLPLQQKIQLDDCKRLEITFYDQDSHQITLNNWCLIFFINQ
jgi:hypothetical protein